MRRRQLILASFLSLILVTNAAADPQTTSRLHWVTDGNVQAAVQVGNTLYIGGTFTRVAPASNTLGSFYGLATASGDPVPGFPLVDGVVNAIAQDGAGGYYIGGAFSSVGGVARRHLAHVLSDGSVDPAFAPTITGSEVTSIALGASSLFIGGRFTAVNDAQRSRFAVLNPISGAVVSWPTPPPMAPKRLLVAGSNLIVVNEGFRTPLDWSSEVRAFDQSTGAVVWTRSLQMFISDAIVSGSRLILGGTSISSGQVQSLDVSTGLNDSGIVGSNGVVNALAVSGTTLYVGGSFSTFGGQTRLNAAAIDIPTATVTDWAPNPDDIVSALVTSAAGTVFLGGAFTHVDGQARRMLAEVNAAGDVSPWVGNAYSSGLRTLGTVGGTLLVGGQMAITGGSARTNLAAFDLSGDTLLPWAAESSLDVTGLEAVGQSIFVEVATPTPPSPDPVYTVSAVHGVTGAPLPWAPPLSPPLPGLQQSVRLLATHDGHVYVSGPFGASQVVNSPHQALVRLDPTTGAIDQAWRPPVGSVSQVAVSDNVMYVAGKELAGTVLFPSADVLRAVDLTTGVVSSWQPSLVPEPPPFTSPVPSVRGLAVDGRTVYVAGALAQSATSSLSGVAAFDATTGLPLMPVTPASFETAAAAIGVADGQVVVARDRGNPNQPIAVGEGVAAYAATGQQATWNPGFTRIDSGVSPVPRSPKVLVTATDVILLGYQGAGTVPVQGVAVLPRMPSPAPTSLRASTLGNQVTMNWDPPTPVPGGYVLDVGTTPSTVDLSIPTGSAATSVSAAAGNGTYYVRVRSANASAGAASLPTNQIGLVAGCSAPPAAPTGLAAQINGADVTLSWNGPLFPAPTSYLIEAGPSSGSRLITATVPATATTVSSPVPPGLYFVRARSVNACGQSEASSEVFFTVGSPNTIPLAPTGLTANVVGSSVSVQWTPSAGALGYRLEVGTAPGKSDLATLPVSTPLVFASGVRTGVYYARVRAGNDAGVSAASVDVVILVPCCFD